MRYPVVTGIAVDNEEYHFVSQLEIVSGMAIYQHLSSCRLGFAQIFLNQKPLFLDFCEKKSPFVFTRNSFQQGFRFV